MVVGFFSDDASALYAALLASCGLACVDRSMTVVEGLMVGGLSCAPLIETEAAQGGLAAAMADDGADVAFVAPLAALQDGEIRSLLDVAVVSGGDPLQAQRARRSVGYAPWDGFAPGTDGRMPFPALTCRPWLLSFGAGRRHGRAASPASWPRGGGDGFAVRVLPVRVPLPGRSVKVALEEGLPTLETLRIGILLAATLEAAAADPEAAAIEPATVAEMMSPASHPTDRALAGRLSALADRLEDIERALGTPAVPCPAARHDRSLRRSGGRPGRVGAPERSPASWPRRGTSASQAL